MMFFNISVLPFAHYLLLLVLDHLLRQQENVYFLWMHLTLNSCKSHLKKLGLLVSSSFNHLLLIPVFSLLSQSHHTLCPLLILSLFWPGFSPFSGARGLPPLCSVDVTHSTSDSRRNSHPCPCSSVQIRASEKWCYQKRWPEHHNTVKEHAEPSAGIAKYIGLCRPGKDGLLIPPLFQSTGVSQLFKKVLRNSLAVFLQFI